MRSSASKQVEKLLVLIFKAQVEKQFFWSLFKICYFIFYRNKIITDYSIYVQATMLGFSFYSFNYTSGIDLNILTKPLIFWPLFI